MLWMLWTVPEEAAPDVEQWIVAYGDSLTRLCFLYLKDYQLAEEAVQDTFYKAYRHYGSFRGDSRLETWLTRIAVNVCKDYRRRPACREAEKRTTIPLALLSEETMGHDEGRELLLAVYALPEGDRRLVLLRYYSGFSVEEIARALRLKPNTVAVRLRRARERLRAML